MSRSASTVTVLNQRLATERELTVLRSGFLRSRRRLHRIARSGRPIVAGPYVSEVGYECLYWVPMLHWFVEHYGIERERITAFSRGGPSSWYGGIAERYVDAFEHIPLKAFKERYARRVAETRNEKQLRPGELERDLLDAAGFDRGVEILQPSVMYQLFWSVWAMRRSLRRVLAHTRFRLAGDPVEPSPRLAEALRSLPEQYVAVKAYFSERFPDTEANRRFLSELLQRLTARANVVLLVRGADIDEHVEYGAAGERIFDLTSYADPRENLDLQTAVARRARALYTTYGGFAHLGPFLGVPTLAFYSVDAFNPVHLDVTQRAVGELRHGSRAGFVLLHASDMDLVERLPGPALEAAGA